MKRILSFILSAIMIVSCFAVTTFAADDAVNNVISLIDAIGDVKYQETSDPQDYAGINFAGGDGDGYSALNSNPQSPYSITFYFSVNSADTSSTKSCLAAFTGYGVYTGYNFHEQKFIIGNKGGWMGAPSDYYGSKDYVLKTGILYKMQFVYGADKTEIYLDDALMCSADKAFEADNYNIIYPQSCNVNIQRFILVENGEVKADVSGTAIKTNDAWGIGDNDKFAAVESFSASTFRDSGSAIDTAEAAYAALSDDQKAEVTNYETLTAARLAYDTLVAAEVDVLIGEIGAVSLESGDAKIVAAEKAYDLLTASQKACVTAYETLVAAREEYNFYVQVDETEKAIDSVGKLDLDKALADTTAVGGDAFTAEGSLGYVNNGTFDTEFKNYQYAKISIDVNYTDYKVTDGKTTYFGCSTNAFGSLGKVGAGYDFANQRFFIGAFGSIPSIGNTPIDTVDAEVAFTLLPNVWYNVVIEYDENTVNIYCDGTLVLTYTYESAPNHGFVIYSSQNVNLAYDNFTAEDFNENTYAISAPNGVEASVPATTRADAAKSVVEATIAKYYALSAEGQAMVSNFDVLKEAGKATGYKFPADVVVDLIDAIGDVKYQETSEPQDYAGVNFTGGDGDGYTALNEGPASPYSMTFYISVDSADTSSNKSCFAAFTGYGVYTGYNFYEQKFIIGNNGGWMGAPSDYYGSKDYVLKTGILYKMQFVYGEDTVSIYLDDVLMCSANKSFEEAYNIIYPQSCNVNIARFILEVGGEVKADVSGTAIKTNDAWGIGDNDKFTAVEAFSASTFKDSEMDIAKAEAAYAALSEAEKADVTNYATLTAARLAYDTFVAAEVDALIGEIGAVSLEAGDAKIVAAEKAYANLTESQKACVTAYETLVAARAEYNFYVEVNAIDKTIDSLGKLDLDGALADTSEVGGAAYAVEGSMGYVNDGSFDTEFKNYQYAKLSIDINYTDYKVTDGMTTYIGCSTNAFGSLGKVGAGYDFANQRFFIGAFASIPSIGNTPITEIDAEVAFSLLPNVWYNIVIEYNENTVNIYCDGTLVLTYTYESAPNHGFVIYSSQNVNFTYDNFVAEDYNENTYAISTPNGEAVTVDATTRSDSVKTAVQSVIDAYNALSEDGKALITNYETLKAIASKIGYEFDETDPDVEAAIALINKIGVVALPKLEWINAAKTAYDALSDAQKAKVTNADVLTAAVEKYTELNNTDWAVKKVESQINGLANMNDASIKDETVMKGVMIQFREVVDGDRYPGYSNFGDNAADKLRADKSFTYEFDINVYDYDAVNGFPAFNGYTNAVTYANGYDFLNGRFYVADYDAMGTGNSMDNGCIGTVYAEAKVDFTLGVWHHYKVVYNGNNITINFDGVDVINYTAPEDAEIPYNYYIQYPQWINCDLANMVFTAADGTTVKAPVDKDSFTSGGGTNAVTMEATTVGAENKKSIEAAYEAYNALTDAQKEQVSNLDTLKSALALIGVEFGNEENVLLGDADENGKVNLKDINRIIRHLAGWTVDINLTNADYDQNGKVNLVDVSKMIKDNAAGKFDE